MACRHGRSADDQLRVLACAWRGGEPGEDRGLPGPGDALDRERWILRQQRPLVAVERPGAAAAGPGPPRSLDPGRPVPASEEAVPVARRQVSRSDPGFDVRLQGPLEARAR